MKLQVGVKVLLQNPEGEYLLVRRNTKTYNDIKGSWDIVGGRIEPGSPLLENLEREVSEETGLMITTEPILLTAQDILRGTEKHVVRLTYTAHTVGEPVLDTSENVEYAWVPLEKLHEHKDLDVYLSEVLRLFPTLCYE